MRKQPLHLLASGCTVVALLASTSGSTAAPPTQVNAFNEVFNDLSNQVDNHVFTIPVGKRLAIDLHRAEARAAIQARFISGAGIDTFVIPKGQSCKIRERIFAQSHMLEEKGLVADTFQ